MEKLAQTPSEEATRVPFRAIDLPEREEQDRGTKAIPDVLLILAEARVKQRKEKPRLEPKQRWISLPDFMGEGVFAALMDAIEGAAINLLMIEPENLAKLFMGALSRMAAEYPEAFADIEHEPAKDGPATDAVPEETGEEGEEEGEDLSEGDRLQMSKASGFMRHVVDYLQGQPIETRITAVLVSRLLIGDVQANLQRMGLYDGQVGDDVLADWQDEVRDLLGDHDTVSLAAHADAAMAGLVAGLEAITA